MNAKKREVETKIAFYQLIADVIRQKEFGKELAERVVVIYEGIKNKVTITGITTDLLRKLHEAHHSDKGNFDSLLWLVRAAFSDLTKQLRWPVVRKTFEDLRHLVDPEGCALLLRIVNVKPLTDNPDGYAVVTMVVDNHRKFREFLLNKNSVECVRFSDDETIAI